MSNQLPCIVHKIPNDSSGAFGGHLHVIGSREVGHRFVECVARHPKNGKSAEARYVSPIGDISDSMFGKDSPRVNRD